MATYILTWNPSRWPWPEQDYAREVRLTASGHLYSSRWSCGNRKTIIPGDRLFLMRQGSDRGLISAGYARSESFFDTHWDDTRDDDALYVDYQSETLLNTDHRLPIERLLEADLGVPWNNLYASGVQVPDESVQRLEKLWDDNLARIGSNPVQSDLIDDSAEGADEGTESTPTANRVLRQIVQRRGQPLFRAELLQAYRGACAITGCDTEAALEAAHIVPYDGPFSNRVANGLLLRADVHTLFDLVLLCIDPSTFLVACSDRLTGTHYRQLQGVRVRLPSQEEKRPSQEALASRWEHYLTRQMSDLYR